MAASHSCPHFPSHHAFWLDFPAICIGCSLPFFVGCHSAARPGFTVTRSLTPSVTCLFEQWGHPLPRLLLPITASHSWPHAPFHQTFLLDPAVTCVGRRRLFFVGCHSDAKSGLTVARSFCPTINFAIWLPLPFNQSTAHRLSNLKKSRPEKDDSLVLSA